MLKIIASMTTLPTRFDKIKTSIVSILQQVNSLEINIPYVCKRTNEEYIIPEWLTQMERVKIYRCEDNGPATKILDTLKRHNDKYIFIMDDDTFYQQNIISEMLKESKKKRAVCTSGIKFINNKYIQIKSGEVEVMEGFGGILLPPQVYNDFIYFSIVLKNEDCYLGDDVVFSNWLKKQGFELWKAKIQMPAQLLFGLSDPSALHKQNNMCKRYFRILVWLHKNNMLYIETDKKNYEENRVNYMEEKNTINTIDAVD